jgi:hypothetical protein
MNWLDRIFNHVAVGAVVCAARKPYETLAGLPNRIMADATSSAASPRLAQDIWDKLSMLRPVSYSQVSMRKLAMVCNCCHR